MTARSVFLLAAFGPALAPAADWPEWRGSGRRGEWTETGIVERLPDKLEPVWRVPVPPGYSGPSVQSGRVFVTGYENGAERALAFDELTGRRLWTRDWPANYRGLEYAVGPRATPTADGDLVVVFGAVGNLLCLRAATGEPVWTKDARADYAAPLPAWGLTAAPLVHGRLLIAVMGGKSGKVVAFDKTTGAEVWRALGGDDSEPGYSQPLLIRAGGRDQLIVWHAGALTSLDPDSGKPLWEHPFKIIMSTPIATPVQAGPFLLVSAFFQGARLFRLDDAAPGAELVWRGKSDSERNTDTIHALMASPLIDGDHIYGVCNYGQLRCLKTATGERVWESQAATVELGRNVTAYLVRHGGRTVIFNDRGELIFARLTPSGYQEQSRARLIEPDSKAGSRRELGAVVWAHPAFANRHAIARNGREMVRVDLSATSARPAPRSPRH